MATQNYQIVNGPSKFDLMLALFDSHGARGKSRTVEFLLEPISTAFTCSQEQKATPQIVHICSVEANDGSAELWDIKAYTVGGEKPEGVLIDCYSTKNRQGSFQIVESAVWARR